MYNSPERGLGRVATNIPLLLSEGEHAAHCRATEISASGIVAERGRALCEREQRANLKLEIYLPGSRRPVRALAKVARQLTPTRYALRFELLMDADRLRLMEFLDRQWRESLSLLDEVSGAA